jgi:dihydrofolate reductase
VRRVVLALQQSLDGFIAGPAGETDWIHGGISPDLEAFLCDHLESADTMLMGRLTYEEQAAVWPRLRGRMADAVNGHTKFVFSSSSPSPGSPVWAGTRFTSRSPAEKTAELREQVGSTIAVSGGPTLIRSLLSGGLIDEFHVTVHPIALGSGLHAFHDRHRFRLVTSRRFTSGAVVSSYARAESAGDRSQSPGASRGAPIQ